MTKKRSSVKKFAVLAATLVLGSVVLAQKLEIETHRDEKADFSTLKTYAWLPPAPAVKNTSDALSNPNLSQEVLGPHIVKAVDAQLAAGSRRWTRIPPTCWSHTSRR
jgi:hypothetical protein